MNVGELKASLMSMPDDLPVIMARDQEGNGFHFLDCWVVSGFSNDDEIDIWEGAEIDDEDDLALVLWP